MKKVVFLWFSFFSLLFFAQISVFACGCILIGGLTFKQEINRYKNNAQVVFAGKVVEISKDGSVTKLKIEKSWKDLVSNNRPQEIIITGKFTSCDFYFEVGKSYLVYASASGNKLRTIPCGGIQELEEAAEQLKILGKGRKPQKLKA